MDVVHLRRVFACFLVGAGVPLLDSACECDCAPAACDFTHVAIEVPPGDILELHATVCSDSEWSSLTVWSEGSSSTSPSVDFAVDGAGVRSDAASLSAEAPYSAALCDDGLTIVIANPGPTRYISVLKIRVDAVDADGRCDIDLDAP